MSKKKMTLKKVILLSIAPVVLSTALGIGTGVAYSYESLLDVFFTKTDYQQSANETELCEDVVDEGIVLLKNENNALPLSSSEKKLALLGQDSVDFVYGGSGSGSVDTANAPTLKTALEREGFTVNSTLWDFYSTGAGKSYRKTTPDETGDGSFNVNEVPYDVYTEDVKSSMNSDDVGICVIGRSGGESSDLPLVDMDTGTKYLQLDKNEKSMIKMACEKFSKVILIVNANNPMELDILEDAEYANVKAAIWVGGVGQEGMYGIANVLKGNANPSGRLVDTYAYDSTSAPSFQNMGDFTITNSTVDKGNKYLVYEEGIYVGYRYYETRYEDVVLGNTTGYDYTKAVQYPFGYGLSYSTFEYLDYKVTQADDKFTVTMMVKNTSEADGKDVVEIYAQKPYISGGVEKAAVELVGYAKTPLIQAGRSASVSIEVDKEVFKSYDADTNKTYTLDPGDYYLAVGTNAHDALNNILAAKGKTTSDGMDYDGNKNLAAVAFHQDALDKTTYAKSSATGYAITNQLDDSDINHYEKQSYLSRSDWNGTFPTPFKGHAWTASQEMLDDLQFYDISTDTSDDAAINAFEFKSNSTDTSYTVQDLKDADYSDSRWDDMIDQLSFAQMTKLIRLGGYATQQVDRIALPKTQDKDGPSGISGTLVGGGSAMAWPAEIVMASTWNDALIENLGVCFGEDSISCGVAGVYGPGADIHRSPYSGRNFEYFSEDGCLSGKIAAAEMKGLRSKGVIAYVKHFALNDQETNRYGASIFASEQAIREVFLKGFEGAVVEGKATALMAAMNRVGTRWVGANKGMMTEILRNEWGFEGMSITDQASVPAMFYQDIVSGLWGGNDMWLNTQASYWSLDAYKEDKNVLYYIHRSAKNIVYSITKSWAVNDAYKSSEAGVVESNITIAPWRTWLTILQIVVYGCSVGLVGFLVVRYIMDSKKKDEPEVSGK